MLLISYFTEMAPNATCYTTATDAPLDEEYHEAMNRPASVLHDFRKMASEDEGSLPPPVVDAYDILPRDDGRGYLAFVLPNVLSHEECDDLIAAAEEYGIVAPGKEFGTPRSAKRTGNYVNEGLSDLVSSRVAPVVAAKFEAERDVADYLGPYSGIHTNWRVLRYDPGDAFPAHQDQMDTQQKVNKADGTKDLILSSHTLLINLSRDGRHITEASGGGATRFYPRAKMRSTAPGQYGYAVDVILPRGWAVVFRQHGLVHAGQPVAQSSPSCKYVAQAGVMRTLPKGQLIKPSVFRLGPGLKRP